MAMGKELLDQVDNGGLSAEAVKSLPGEMGEQRHKEDLEVDSFGQREQKCSRSGKETSLMLKNTWFIQETVRAGWYKLHWGS